MMNTKELHGLFIQNPGISTDSRNIIPGSLFFALKGESFDGNNYALQALEKGAAFSIVDNKEFNISERTILVEDVLKELQNLANFHRRYLGIPIIGITGTNGKTTTKELISSVLSQKFNISYTQGNHNNHIGVPLTLLSMNSKTEIGVVEMGANHQGEIEFLCNIANPDFGLITNVGKAHLEGFGSFEGVKRAKSELYRYLAEQDGTAFINTGNQHLVELSSEIVKRITYGLKDAKVCGKLLSSDKFVSVLVETEGLSYTINSNLAGDYNVENILSAACIGHYFGIQASEIQYAINHYEPVNNRSQFIEKGSLKILMDAYNANPTSMQASLQSFISESSQNKVVILGDMLELGEYSNDEHLAILNMLKQKNCSQVYLIGSEFSKVSKGFGFQSFQTVDDFCEYLAIHKITNVSVLIKGSRGIKLEKALQCL